MKRKLYLLVAICSISVLALVACADNNARNETLQETQGPTDNEGILPETSPERTNDNNGTTGNGMDNGTGQDNNGTNGTNGNNGNNNGVIEGIENDLEGAGDTIREGVDDAGDRLKEGVDDADDTLNDATNNRNNNNR